MKKQTLIVLLGPTGVGKTDLSLQLAEAFHSPIISADSRQIYQEIPIGTAAATPEQQARVKHYFVGTHSLTDYFSASQFEEETLQLLHQWENTNPQVLMTGGSMMYIDAVCKGLDNIPTIKPNIRQEVFDTYNQVGLAPFLTELEQKDPEHFKIVDQQNYKRVLHAIEICRQTGKTYTSFRTNKIKERPFKIIKIGLFREREELCDRINQRVDLMIQEGLVEEAQKVYPLRHLNALNTVGYKELFKNFDGEWTLDFAIEKIKRNSRVYARKQMTWFKRDKEIQWFFPTEEDNIFSFIKKNI